MKLSKSENQLSAQKLLKTYLLMGGCGKYRQSSDSDREAEQ
jgi:hypothetical protein